MTDSNLPAERKDPSQRTTVVIPVPAPPDPASVRVSFGARTNVGNVRPNDEDQFLIARLSKSLEILASSVPIGKHPEVNRPEGTFFLIADGMGGHAGGELASATVVNEAVKHLLETAKWFYRLDDPDENVRLRLLRETLERVDRQLVEEGKADPALAGMGTTLTALSIIGAEAFIVYVGDSRAYLFRDGFLEQLTRDHTVAQELVDQGLLRPEDARTHRLRHTLTNVIGGKPGVKGEIVKLRFADGDRLLLCTDGLNGAVPDDRIAEVLGRALDPEETCKALIDLALGQGGQDNVTVVLAAVSMQKTGD